MKKVKYDEPIKGFKEQKKKKSPLWNKPKTNRIDNIERVPRPKGLTHLCEAYNKEDITTEVPIPHNPTPPQTEKQLIKRSIDKVIINNYIGQCLYVVDYDEYQVGRIRLMSLDELGISMGLTREKVLKRLTKIAIKDESFNDKEYNQGLARVLMIRNFSESLNVGLKAEKWLDTLMALGMARNMPIGIQKELNAAFNMVAGYKRLGLEHIKSMMPHINHQVPNSDQKGIPNTTNGVQYLDATQAVNLLNNQGHNLINETTIQYIEITENIANTPNVVATAGDAQMSIVKNRIFSGHETRRAEELGTYAEILPEGPDGQGGLKNEPPIGMVPDKA